MFTSLQLDYRRRRPSVAAYMFRALYPAALRKPGAFPPIRVRCQGLRLDPGDLAEFLRLTGLTARQGVPVVYPHVFGFRLLMAAVTHPACPIRIFRILQIRNHLLQHGPIDASDVLDLETRVAGQRVLEKGREVDVHTTVRCAGELKWESLCTFYYRGRFGEAGAPSPLARPPPAGGETLASWRTSGEVAFRVARLTGDYNPIHYWRPYARLWGFRQAFHHSQLVLGQCLARLPAPGPVQRLDAWLRGPVYYGSEVCLRGGTGEADAAFALVPSDDERPAIVGRWRSVEPGSALLDGLDAPPEPD